MYLIPVVGAIAILVLGIKLKVARQEIRLLKLEPRPKPSFGLTDLEALQSIITDKGRGATLASVLGRLGVPCTIGADFEKYGWRVAENQKDMAQSVQDNTAEIARLSDRNRTLGRDAEALTKASAAIAALVANTN